MALIKAEILTLQIHAIVWIFVRNKDKHALCPCFTSCCRHVNRLHSIRQEPISTVGWVSRHFAAAPCKRLSKQEVQKKKNSLRQERVLPFCTVVMQKLRKGNS